MLREASPDSDSSKELIRSSSLHVQYTGAFANENTQIKKAHDCAGCRVLHCRWRNLKIHLLMAYRLVHGSGGARGATERSSYY